MSIKNVVTIRQALQYVADNPSPASDVLIDLPTHELVARTLFELANGATVDSIRSQQRANNARTLIFNRLVGRRRAGSHPATRQEVHLTFTDLTKHQLGGSRGQ